MNVGMEQQLSHHFLPCILGKKARAREVKSGLELRLSIERAHARASIVKEWKYAAGLHSISMKLPSRKRNIYCDLDDGVERARGGIRSFLSLVAGSSMEAANR